MAAYREKEDTGAGLRRLKEALKQKTPARCYIFFGEEDYLRNYYLDALKAMLLDGPAAEFNYHRFSAETMDCNALQDALNAIPMMAEHSMIRVDDYDLFKAREEDRTKLTELLSDLPEYCTLVFHFATVPWKPDKRMKKLWEAVSGNAEIVEFSKQSERELCAWITRRLKKLNKEIDGQLASYLVFLTGASMTTLAGEIEKLAAYSDAPAVSKAEIDAVVEPVLDAVVFDITGALAKGDYATAMQKLQTVLKKQEEPIPVLGAISAQFRRLRAARVLLSEGRRADDLSRLCGIQRYPAEMLMSAAATVPTELADKAVLLCEETDFRIKYSYDTPERMLELLLLKISEEARHA